MTLLKDIKAAADRYLTRCEQDFTSVQYGRYPSSLRYDYGIFFQYQMEFTILRTAYADRWSIMQMNKSRSQISTIVELFQ